MKPAWLVAIVVMSALPTRGQEIVNVPSGIGTATVKCSPPPPLGKVSIYETPGSIKTVGGGVICGERLTVLAESKLGGGFTEVRTAAGIQGWVMSRWLDSERPQNQLANPAAVSNGATELASTECKTAPAFDAISMYATPGSIHKVGSVGCGES